VSTFHVWASDYAPDESWRIVDWCVRRGADEFGLSFVGAPYVRGTAWAEADALLAPFRRRIASTGDRWMVTGESLAVLRELMSDGLFAFDAAGPGALDPTFFRGGQALLAIASREGWGVLDLADDDAESLRRSGLVIRDLGRPR
jgi:hypothetical protein